MKKLLVFVLVCCVFTGISQSASYEEDVDELSDLLELLFTNKEQLNDQQTIYRLDLASVVLQRLKTFSWQFYRESELIKDFIALENIDVTNCKKRKKVRKFWTLMEEAQEVFEKFMDVSGPSNIREYVHRRSERQKKICEDYINEIVERGINKSEEQREMFKSLRSQVDKRQVDNPPGDESDESGIDIVAYGCADFILQKGKVLKSSGNWFFKFGKKEEEESFGEKYEYGIRDRCKDLKSQIGDLWADHETLCKYIDCTTNKETEFWFRVSEICYKPLCRRNFFDEVHKAYLNIIKSKPNSEIQSIPK